MRSDTIAQLKAFLNQWIKSNPAQKISGDKLNEALTLMIDTLDGADDFINVHKVNPKNELVSYTITDVIGNRIIINNKFMCSDYIGTDIELNDHKTSIKDISYVNNIMLKKPYATEEDLYYALSHLGEIPRIHSPHMMSTRRKSVNSSEDISNYIINSKKECKPAPRISAENINLIKF